jgi:hypothetical protein
MTTVLRASSMAIKIRTVVLICQGFGGPGGVSRRRVAGTSGRSGFAVRERILGVDEGPGPPPAPGPPIGDETSSTTIGIEKHIEGSAIHVDLCARR